MGWEGSGILVGWGGSGGEGRNVYQGWGSTGGGLERGEAVCPVYYDVARWHWKPQTPTGNPRGGSLWRLSRALPLTPRDVRGQYTFIGWFDGHCVSVGGVGLGLVGLWYKTTINALFSNVCSFY